MHKKESICLTVHLRGLDTPTFDIEYLEILIKSWREMGYRTIQFDCYTPKNHQSRGWLDIYAYKEKIEKNEVV